MTEIDKMSKTKLAASIDLNIFESIYKELDKLFKKIASKGLTCK